jgi:peptidoglycan hydrolase-like protein with peptidoglycan-binding domain
MARQSARQPKKISGLEIYSGIAARRAGAFVSENPALVGGSTAFAVTLFFIASNALWYQPNAHRGAFFETRPLSHYKAPELPQSHSKLTAAKKGKEDVFRIVRDTAPEADPVVRDIQSALIELAIYDGSVDGIAGPRTLAAIRQFQQKAGLEPNGRVGPPLLDAIRTASVPAPRLKRLPPKASESAPALDGNAEALSAEDIKRIQAALQKHGHEEVDADGIAGSKTSEAIKVFQSARKLKATGVADAELLRAMSKAGWVKS